MAESIPVRKELAALPSQPLAKCAFGVQSKARMESGFVPRGKSLNPKKKTKIMKKKANIYFLFNKILYTK